MSTPLHWKKTSFSGQTECVELAWPADGIAVRDSKNATGPTLRLDHARFAGFLAHVRESGHPGRS